VPASKDKEPEKLGSQKTTSIKILISPLLWPIQEYGEFLPVGQGSEDLKEDRGDSQVYLSASNFQFYPSLLEYFVI
jgi:hypothetical protein